MDLSELQPRRNSKGLAHLGWSGVAPLEAELSSTAIAIIVAALPRPPRSPELFRQNLLRSAGRFQRSLRQCEFGPTRPDQKAMIKWQLPYLERIKELLLLLSAEQASEFSAEMYEHLSKKSHVDSETILKSMHEAELSIARHDQIINEIQELCIRLIQCTDTNTASYVFLDELAGASDSFRLPSPDRFSFSTIMDWLDVICAKRRALLKTREHGPEPSESLWIAVYSLAELFKQETGQPVTHYRGHDFAGPQSPAGRFILTAVGEFLPPLDIFPAEMLATLNIRARTFLDCRNQIPQRVAEILKLYVREVERPAGRGRKRLKITDLE
jgi:hypothetical protein